MSFLDSECLGHVIQKFAQRLSGFVPSSRTINGLPLSSNVTLGASDVSALPITGGTLTGNLTIKGSSNYGTKINLGDGDYVHISEPSDDCLEVKAKKVNFVLSDSTDTKFTINGANPFAALSSGGGSGSMEVISYKGTGDQAFTLRYATNKTPVSVLIFGSYDGSGSSGYNLACTNAGIVFGGLTSTKVLGAKMVENLSTIQRDDTSVTLNTANKQIVCNAADDAYINSSGYLYSATIFFA